MKVIAVVVTFNRLALLKKSLRALDQQDRKPDQIVVINNSSTDGTAEWLQSQSYTTCTLENKGGAAGFAFGIKKAYELKADWIWLMDDDTIPEPNALQVLEQTLIDQEAHQHQIGFLSSRVLWADGTLHNMNRTLPLKSKAPFALDPENQNSFIRSGTFVSMLLSAKAVEKVGLPFKEFFIWCDDYEYSTRIIHAGMIGIEVHDSVVVHETPTNHKSNVFKDPQGTVWKYEFGLRNELFTMRMHEGEKKFWYALAKRIVVWPYHVIKKRKDHRWAFMKLIWRTSIKAIWFYPRLEKVERTPVVRTKEMEPGNTSMGSVVNA